LWGTGGISPEKKERGSTRGGPGTHSGAQKEPSQCSPEPGRRTGKGTKISPEVAQRSVGKRKKRKIGGTRGRKGPSRRTKLNTPRRCLPASPLLSGVSPFPNKVGGGDWKRGKKRRGGKSVLGEGTAEEGKGHRGFR